MPILDSESNRYLAFYKSQAEIYFKKRIYLKYSYAQKAIHMFKRSVNGNTHFGSKLSRFAFKTKDNDVSELFFKCVFNNMILTLLKIKECS